MPDTICIFLTKAVNIFQAFLDVSYLTLSLVTTGTDPRAAGRDWKYLRFHDCLRLLHIVEQ